MAFPHGLKSTQKTTIITLSGTNADGDAQVPINVPTGRKLVALLLSTVGTATGTVFALKHYVDAAQATTGKAVKVLEQDDTAQAATVTVTAGTNGTMISPVPGDTLFLGVGVYSVYGFELDVNITGAGGSWEAVAICTEA